jgi:hypothetical protein
MEAAMSKTSVLIHGPAPAPDGPIACTLRPSDYAGRLEAFHRAVFSHLVGLERPEPTRLRLHLAEAADPEAVRELLVREQGCCAFLGFTIIARDGHLVADLEVRPEAASTLDAMASLAELAAPGGDPINRTGR